jgi:hypothetical protein
LALDCSRHSAELIEVSEDKYIAELVITTIIKAKIIFKVDFIVVDFMLATA